MLSPPKLPASQVTPGAQKPILATRRRSLQMVLRLLAAAAGHWLGNRLNDYLRDPDEYRGHHPPPAPPRRHDHQHAPRAHRDPRPPAAPRITRALALLIEEINATPPRMPSDSRQITYQLAAHPRI